MNHSSEKKARRKRADLVNWSFYFSIFHASNLVSFFIYVVVFTKAKKETTKNGINNHKFL